MKYQLKTGTSKPFAAFKKLMPTLKGERKIISIAFVALICNTLTALVAPLIIAHTINTAILHKDYPGVGLKRTNEGWEVTIPPEFNIDPEEQFSLVVKKYLKYLKEGNIPGWEISGMLAKYYTTTRALEKAVDKHGAK